MPRNGSVMSEKCGRKFTNSCWRPHGKDALGAGGRRQNGAEVPAVLAGVHRSPTSIRPSPTPTIAVGGLRGSGRVHRGRQGAHPCRAGPPSGRRPWRLLSVTRTSSRARLRSGGFTDENLRSWLPIVPEAGCRSGAGILVAVTTQLQSRRPNRPSPGCCRGRPGTCSGDRAAGSGLHRAGGHGRDVLIFAGWSSKPRTGASPTTPPAPCGADALTLASRSGCRCYPPGWQPNSRLPAAVSRRPDRSVDPPAAASPSPPPSATSARLVSI